jgi:hypothetical protein
MRFVDKIAFATVEIKARLVLCGRLPEMPLSKSALFIHREDRMGNTRASQGWLNCRQPAKKSIEFHELESSLQPHLPLRFCAIIPCKFHLTI